MFTRPSLIFTLASELSAVLRILSFHVVDTQRVCSVGLMTTSVNFAVYCGSVIEYY